MRGFSFFFIKKIYCSRRWNDYEVVGVFHGPDVPMVPAALVPYGPLNADFLKLIGIFSAKNDRVGRVVLIFLSTLFCSREELHVGTFWQRFEHLLSV